MLTRSPDRSLTEQLAERFAERIRTRLLPAGARLPSVRECARQQGVSPYTVVAAYDKLLAQGLVEARRQRGFYVRDIVQKMPLAQDGQAQTAILSEATAASPLGPMGLCLPGSRINATGRSVMRAYRLLAALIAKPPRKVPNAGSPTAAPARVQRYPSSTAPTTSG